MQQAIFFTLLQRQVTYVDNKVLTFTGEKRIEVLGKWGETEEDIWKQATTWMHETPPHYGRQYTVMQVFPTGREDNKHENELLK